ncbi:MAG: tetratricopeptide repeat protein, partial [Myxococcota bacterium]
WIRLGWLIGYRGKDFERAEPILAAAEAAVLRAGEPDALRGDLLNTRAAILYTKNDNEGALALFVESLSARERALPPGHPDIARSLTNLGSVARSLGRFDQSLRYAQRALDLKIASLGEGHPSTATSRLGLAVTHLRQGRVDRAIELLRAALAVQRDALSEHHPEVAKTVNELGKALLRSGRPEQAAAHHREAIAIAAATLGAEHAVVGKYNNELGLALRALEQHEDALAAFRRTLAIQRAALGEDHFEVAVALVNQGQTLALAGQCAEAMTPLGRALTILEAKKPAFHAAFPLTAMGMCHLERGQRGAAVLVLERALVLRRDAGIDPALVGDTEFVLARALWRAGSPGERRRALTLARSAADRFRSGRKTDQLTEVQDWLSQRGAVQPEPPAPEGQ